MAALAFNNYALDYLHRSPTIKTVVPASSWRPPVAPAEFEFWSKDEIGSVGHPSGPEFALAALSGTIDAVHRLGRNVVLIGPPPASEKDTSACLERLATDKIVLGGGCEIWKEPALETDAGVRTLLSDAGLQTKSEAVFLSNALCATDLCLADVGGVGLYRDRGHLSNDGSKRVMDLVRKAGLLSGTGIN